MTTPSSHEERKYLIAHDQGASMDVSLLQTLGVVEILLDLLAHGPSRKVDFRKRTGLAPSTLGRAHALLYTQGYIITEPHPRSLLFRLSPKGERMAKFLREIVEENVN